MVGGKVLEQTSLKQRSQQVAEKSAGAANAVQLLFHVLFFVWGLKKTGWFSSRFSFLCCFWDSLECIAASLWFSWVYDHLLEAPVMDKYCPVSKKLLYGFLCHYWHAGKDLVMKTDLLPKRKWVFWLTALVEGFAQAAVTCFSCAERFLFYWLGWVFFPL